MNKKELTEIKRNFTDSSPFFTLERVLSAYVDPSGTVLSMENKNYALIPEDEGIVIMDTLKKLYGGKLGANLLEYHFPQAEYDEDGSQRILYDTVYSKLQDDTACTALIQRIASNIEYPDAYTILIGFCTYSISSISEANVHKYDFEDDCQYNFIAAAICPSESGDNGLMFDSENRKITKNATADTLINQAPTDGFFFPVFSDRSPDVNSVMYYTKTPKRPNLSVIEDVLRCKFVMTCQQEKEAYQQIITEVAGEELSYFIIAHVNEALFDLASQITDGPQMPMLDKEEFFDILANAGVSEEKLQAFSDCFKDKLEYRHTEKLTISNLAESKLNLSNSYVSVSIDHRDAGKVHTSVYNGRRCIVIDLDDPSLLVNGMPVHL